MVKPGWGVHNGGIHYERLEGMTLADSTDKQSKKGPLEQLKVKEGNLTYDDYAAMPDDGIQYELANGVLEAMSPAPGTAHQVWSKYLQQVLDQTCQEEFIILLAPLDVILSDKEVRQPDLVAVHVSRVDIITERGIEGAPDLVVEILSPHSVKRDRMQKLNAYALYEIPEYWIVDSGHRTLEQYVLRGQGYTLAQVYMDEDIISSSKLPCAQFSMADVARRLPKLPNLRSM